MESKFVCPCGLVCSDCLFYKSDIYEAAEVLKSLLKKTQLDTFLSILAKPETNGALARHLGVDENLIRDQFEVFLQLPVFFDVLDGIIRIQCKKTCRESGGCSFAGNTKQCEAVQCVKEKGYSGCWECEDHEKCPKLLFVKRSYGETIEGNFNIINTEGVASLKSRGNKYYEWQRKLKGK